ncbi:MAG TPA: DUF445 family protein [Candidatus Anaerobutyricum stercoripullorum]|uniref:DUF445 family protein n=1 Tax=Candidatus Anaerobutyricum stercoripullorum TaxID=2838456 RepID=A0A9D1X258_9FIRM|nr:DUF445 family protein [Candidatus Anaerobutyricum stercoripullorum]
MIAYWKLITTPLIGAVIGYATNWVAVKMLFRPRKEICVFGKRLPFTPGVIPRGKARLARAIGRAVEEQLLTAEVLKEVLLSSEKKERLRREVSAFLEKERKSEESLRQAAQRLLPEERIDDFVESAEETVTDMVYDKVLQMNVGEIIADKVMESAREKLKDSMFGMMLGGSVLEPIVRQVEEKINAYVAEYGRGVIEQMVLEESEKLQAKTVGETVCRVEEYGVDIPSVVLAQYETMVSEKLPQILGSLQLSAVVEERINAMEVEQVEELMLSIMKKELSAVVNLGALIGLILGLINAAILYI